jgi:hypothetical protein
MLSKDVIKKAAQNEEFLRALGSWDHLKGITDRLSDAVKTTEEFNIDRAAVRAVRDKLEWYTTLKATYEEYIEKTFNAFMVECDLEED